MFKPDSEKKPGLIAGLEQVIPLLPLTVSEPKKSHGSYKPSFVSSLKGSAITIRGICLFKLFN